MPNISSRRLARTSRLLANPFLAAMSLCCLGADANLLAQDDLAEQRVQYDEDAPKTTLELQRYRTVTRLSIRRADGVVGTATLTNLSPEANSWYLLSLDWPGAAERVNFHLENPSPKAQELQLLSTDPRVIDITTAAGSACRLWAGGSASAVDAAAASGLPYAPLCSGALYLRNPIAGHHTSLERITDFLRDRVWGGDKIISFAKREVFRDEFLEKNSSSATPTTAQLPAVPHSPAPAAVTHGDVPEAIVPNHLELDVDTPGKEMLAGQWYAVPDLDGVSVSAIAPENIEKSILAGREVSVNPLGALESKALVYLVAFDLEAFNLHFALGTDHPRLDWSDRPPLSSQDARLPGPDGVANPAPLILNGMVSPADAASTIAAFAGGFKRIHGAFKYGPLAERNHGSHYGFVEKGVVLSKLQPGLATVVVMDDGAVDVRTWSQADDVQLGHIRYARQNGVPLIEYDARLERAVPGNLVNLWGPGNWSGSADEDLRTLRAGLCLQENQSRRFLVYGYFSAATPSGMARVFQAYHCRYAMHLDMNALEHTYLALYARRGHQVLVEHLIQGMDEVDRTTRDGMVPRFLGFPDDRDFFYLTRRVPSR